MKRMITSIVAICGIVAIAISYFALGKEEE